MTEPTGTEPMSDTLATTIEQLDVTMIRAGDNDRTTFAAAELHELASNIAVNGLAQPITVRPVHDVDGTTFEIVCGERRYRACTTILGWTTIPALVRQLDDREASAIMLAENLARVDLDPVSEGRCYRKRIDQGMTVDEIASMGGVPVTRVRHRLRIVDALNGNALDDYVAGLLNHQQAFELCSIDKDRQDTLLRAMRRERFSTVEWRRLLDSIRAAQHADAETGLFDGDLFALQVETFATEARRQPTFTRRAALDLIERLAAHAPDDTRADALAFVAAHRKGAR